MSIARLSVKFRHFWVKMLAPKLYADWSKINGLDMVMFERPMISFLKKSFGDKPLVGCEIGVRNGINAARIMKTLNMEKLFLVDSYKPYFEPLFPVTSSSGYHAEMKWQAEKLLGSFADKVFWLIDSSDEAVKRVNCPLDFCYIDGDHSYAQVKQDLKNYSKLVCSGGVIGGHDFNTTYFGLCTAVLEFKMMNDDWLNLQGAGWDWWMIKK